MVSTRSSSAALPRSPSPPQLPPTKTPRKTAAASATSRSSRASSSRGGWAHAPSSLTLFWMAVSLPLVAWDTGYVLLRPRSMPGGSLHWPLWTPYALYGEIDHMYGAKQWSAGNGFTAAQGSMNLIESAMYVAYLWLWSTRAQQSAGAGARRAVAGRAGALAVLLGFSAAVMTVSKTLLYWLNEGFSGFDNIGQNDAVTLFFLWIIPNGAWLVFPTIMIFEMGSEILNVLATASAPAIKSE